MFIKLFHLRHEEDMGVNVIYHSLNLALNFDVQLLDETNLDET